MMNLFYPLDTSQVKRMRFVICVIFSLGVALAAPSSIDPGYNCRPGQKCWPTLQEWQQLNHTIDGHLYQTIPLGAPCYANSTYYDAAVCSVVENDYNNSIPRGGYYGQTYWPNWEACGTSGCSLLSSSPEETLYSTCSLGRLATYYVDVRNTSHISAALQFAKVHNIRISVKNTGHDFFGRSTVPNSLAIWTHNLKNLDFHQSFTAHNCPSANAQNVGEMGAGVIAGDAYRFFNSHGVDITGGYEESVGIAGGFGQGGGVGDYTTTYGLMVDNAVEFEVVTAEGQVRTINECNDPELFWAMRGGGGGTYAILTKYRVQVYPSVPVHTYNFLATFKDTTNATQRQGLREVLTAHANSQIIWSSQLVTGQVDYSTKGVSFGLVLPYADDGSKLKRATASFFQSVSNLTYVNVLENNYTSFPTYTDYLAFSAIDARATEPAGIFSLLASRLLPRHLFNAPETVDSLVSAVIEGMEKARRLLPLQRTGAQVVLETPLSTPDNNQKTSALPAWREAMWHVIHVGEWYEPLAPAALQKATDGFLEMLEPLKKLSPGGGAYFNEAHYGEPDWEQTFFGANYDRLLEIKNQYDPTHIFDCYKCVGWRGKQE
jgi:FAD/FMN-containing dehydrogenase